MQSTADCGESSNGRGVDWQAQSRIAHAAWKKSAVFVIIASC
jgi:hypothetical protein